MTFSPPKAPSENEFDSSVDVALELGIDPAALLPVVRDEASIEDGTTVSAVVWGADPQIAFLHGGGQNAHTWDLVCVQRGIPAIAVDLPGHGHSAWRDDRDYGPFRNARAIEQTIDALAPSVTTIVGMSLGGLTSIRLATLRPDLAQHLVVVDVTPGVDPAPTAPRRGPTELLRQRQIYGSREEMIEAAVHASPNRSAQSVARAVQHNSVRREDGSWTWRHDFSGSSWISADRPLSELWRDIELLKYPLLLVKGADSNLVSAANLEELHRRSPESTVSVVAGAGHAVQSDQPVALSNLIDSFTR